MDVRTCQKCGAVHPATDRFCPGCGWDCTVEYVKQGGPVNQADYKKAFQTIAVFLGIIIVIVVCVLVNQSGKSSAPAGVAYVSPTPARTVSATPTTKVTLPPATPVVTAAPTPVESKLAISKPAMKNYIEKAIPLAYKGKTYIVDILTPLSENGYIVSPQLDSELFTSEAVCKEVCVEIISSLLGAKEYKYIDSMQFTFVCKSKMICILNIDEPQAISSVNDIRENIS